MSVLLFPWRQLVRFVRFLDRLGTPRCGLCYRRERDDKPDRRLVTVCIARTGGLACVRCAKRIGQYSDEPRFGF